ncbi:MAG: FecR domain-containing protein [Gelidibacter sp.]
MIGKSHKNINFQQFSKKEKAQLKQRVTTSVYSYMRRRRVLIYGTGITAATIVILLSIGVFNTLTTNANSSSIEAFAKATNHLESSNKVQLVLSDEHNIEISEDNSAISYSSTGEQVRIGKAHSVSQKTLHKDKVVFNTLIVPFGKRSEIVLSDGSKVWLNSGSKLIFPAQFGEDKREVYLEGEAVFEVAHLQKKPFLVKSEHQEIEVLGTVFNVSNYKDDGAIYTVLQSGSIQIKLTDAKVLNSPQSIKITPGTLAIFDKEEKNIKTKAVATEPYFSWRDGIFIFKNDSLNSIMKKISRYYNIEIVINDKNLANETFSGYLDVKENIEHVMQTIKATQTSEFDYQLTQDNRLIIN